MLHCLYSGVSSSKSRQWLFTPAFQLVLCNILNNNLIPDVSDTISVFELIKANLNGIQDAIFVKLSSTPYSNPIVQNSLLIRMSNKNRP